jgi:hypothetical protein
LSCINLFVFELSSHLWNYDIFVHT